jgi:hypothetical protein
MFLADSRVLSLRKEFGHVPRDTLNVVPRSSGNFSGGDILPISSGDLIALGERGEGVRYRHLAGLPGGAPAVTGHYSATAWHGQTIRVWLDCQRV